MHATIRQFFDRAVGAVNSGGPAIAERMMDFPEVNATMLGLSKGQHRGRGLGKERSQIIYRELVSNPDILERGIGHLAEMQLLVDGVGFDMVSDMCTNIAKPWFVDYTQRQCRLHGIPLESGVRVEHVFDWEELAWDDEHADLPVHPGKGTPILLVPRSVVRTFADIDYRDFWDTTYRYILRDIEVQRSLQAIGRAPKITWKEINEKYNFCKTTVVRVLHEAPDLKRTYLAEKDRRTDEIAAPVDLRTVSGADTETTPVEAYVAELAAIRPGNADAKKYEALMLRILTRLFCPPLLDPHEQVSSHDGREIIDLTFHNAAADGFWRDMKLAHGATVVMAELKNMTTLSNDEVFQTAARLNDVKGKFGVLIARASSTLDRQRAYRRLYLERKVVMILTDDDVVDLLRTMESGGSPTHKLAERYRSFMEEA